MTTSGVYSQKQLTSSPTTRTITSVQRDSIFVKIQRGKIDAEKLLFLRSLYQSATKTLYVKVIQLKDMRADSLEVIILKQREIEKI
jgi:hypothetical protein